MSATTPRRASRGIARRSTRSTRRSRTAERARGARRAIGAIKGHGVAYRPEREAQVLARLQSANRGPLSNEAVAGVFRQVMSACLALEQTLRIAYLGPAGTFSHDAVARHFGQFVEAVPCATIDEVFRAGESGQTDHAVVPVENSSEGAIGRTLDLMCQTRSRSAARSACASGRTCCRRPPGSVKSRRSTRTRNRSRNAHNGSRSTFPAPRASPWRATPKRRASPLASQDRRRSPARTPRRSTASTSSRRTSRTSRTTRRASGCSAGSPFPIGRDDVLVMSAPNRPGPCTACSGPLRPTVSACRDSNRARAHRTVGVPVLRRRHWPRNRRRGGGGACRASEKNHYAQTVRIISFSDLLGVA